MYSNLRVVSTGINADYGQNSVGTNSNAEINRLLSELNSRLSRELDGMMSSVNTQIQRAISDAIDSQILPQIQTALYSGSGHLTQNSQFKHNDLWRQKWKNSSRLKIYFTRWSRCSLTCPNRWKINHFHSLLRKKRLAKLSETLAQLTNSRGTYFSYSDEKYVKPESTSNSQNINGTVWYSIRIQQKLPDFLEELKSGRRKRHFGDNAPKDDWQFSYTQKLPPKTEEISEKWPDWKMALMTKLSLI